jgi:hypothetical protein
MRVEDENMDVLQNMEAIITTIYRENPDLTDFDVLGVLESLIDRYTAEKLGRAPRNNTLSAKEQELLGDLTEICEWRMGRRSLEGIGTEGGGATQVKVISTSKGPADLKPEDALISAPDPKTVDEILKCLKRIQKSVMKWNRQGGRRGYLDFITHYV